VVAAWRQLKLLVWARRAKARLKWVGITLQVEAGQGVVFVRNPLVLVGADPPARPGSLIIRLGRRVRFAHGVTIEAEPGRDSLLEIGDGTRVGANARFHLRGGAIRIGAGSEIRDDCVLTANGGELELAEHCFIGYDAVLDASDRVVLEERVAIADRVRIADSDEAGEVPEAVEIGAETIVFENAEIATGAHVGAYSQVAPGALVYGEHPDGALLAGAPARVVGTVRDED
jgi:carbonic anhydrase/acetyltransferase-like protein (isoleucine patch superfamily)